jgi:hypothetical protein
MILNRFDSYWDEKIIKKKNDETLQTFFQKCQNKLEKNTFEFKSTNSTAQILRIGNLRSNRYSRIYAKKEFLRFEHKMKGDLIENCSILLKNQNLLQFENEITKNFLTYFAKKLPLDSNYTQWIVIKLRSLQKSYALDFKTDYITIDQIQNLKNQENLVTFVKFLIYIKKLDYQKEFLGTTSYRCVFFKLRHFLEFQNPSN